MKQHRTAEQVKKYDYFKVITFGILVLLLLLAYGFLRPAEPSPAATVAEVTSEPETPASQTPPTAASSSDSGAAVTTEAESAAPQTAPTAESSSDSGTAATTEAESAAPQTAPTTESSTGSGAESTLEAEATTPPPASTTEASAGSEAEVKLTTPTLDLPAGKLTAGPLTLTGTGEPGTEVEIVVDGQVVGKATVGSNGTWSFNADLPEPGEYQVSVQNVDAAGQVLAASEAVALTVEAAETAPVVVAPTLDIPAGGIVTSPGEVVLTGAGEPGSEVEIVVDGQVVGKTTVGNDGKWDFTAALAPQTRAYELSVQAVDAAGQVLAVTEPASLTIAAPVSAGAAPTLDLPAEGLTAGPVTLTGTGEPGSQVQVVVDGQPVGTATVDSEGRWSFPTELTKAGDYEIGVQSVDAEGKVGAASEVMAVRVTEAEKAVAEAPASLDQGDGQAYIVQAEDWLSKLALKFYNDMTQYPVIVEATNARAKEDSSFTVITNPDLIEIGQKVWIPNQTP